MKRSMRLFLLIGLLSAPAYAAGFDQDGYCLKVEENAQSNIEAHANELAGTKFAEIKIFLSAAARQKVQARKQTLAAHGLYSLQTDTPSPQILDSMHQADLDGQAIKTDAYGQCMKNCGELAKTSNDKTAVIACARQCSPQMGEGDRRLVSCAGAIP